MTSDRRQGQSGQSTIEFLFSFSVAMITIVGVGWVFKAEWDRGKCAYLVFEKTHAALVENLPSDFNLDYKSRIRIEKSPTSVKGVGICGNASEMVTLPNLQVGSL